MHKMKVKVSDNLNLVRDLNTNAILNTNYNDYKNYLKIKQQKENENKRVDKIESDVMSIKKDIQDIKELLRCLIKE